MPHNHIFMHQGAIDALGLIKLTGAHASYSVARGVTIEKFVADIVKDAFRKHAGEDLEDDQIIQYAMCVTHSMPKDMNVNLTAWYTPERAPHFEAIEREVYDQLYAWAPALNIEVHVIPVGAPKPSPSPAPTPILP